MKEVKYNYTFRDGHDFTRHRNWFQYSGENKGFFIKPHINIGQLYDHNETISFVSTQKNNTTTESFHINIWTLKVENKNWSINYIVKKIKLNQHIPKGEYSFSKNAYNCEVLANIIEGKNIKYEHEIPLFWKKFDLLHGRNITIPEQGSSRDQFLRVIPLYTIGDLFHRRSTDFPIDIENEIFLFLTFKDLDSFYLISNLNRSSITHFDMPLLSFQLDNQYILSIRILGDGKELINKKFTLNAKKWNDIQLIPK